jgi:hypothetical protein
MKHLNNIRKRFGGHSVIKEYSAEAKIAQYEVLLSERSYSQKYKTLYWICFVVSYLAQIASAGSSFLYFQKVIGHSVYTPLLATVLALVVVGLIELLKRELMDLAARDLFAVAGKKINYMATFFLVPLSIFSIYASVLGGGDLGVNHKITIDYKTIGQKNTDSIANVYNKQIDAVKSEISDILHRSTYLGNTYVKKSDQKILVAKEATYQNILNLRDSLIHVYQLGTQKEIANAELLNEEAKIKYRWGFAVFELVFFLVMLFVWQYRKMCLLEYFLVNEPQQKVISLPQSQPQQQEPLPNAVGNNSRIGFVFGNTPKKNVAINTKQCEVCGVDYAPTRKTQRFCCDDCRYENHYKTKGNLHFLKKEEADRIINKSKNRGK